MPKINIVDFNKYFERDEAPAIEDKTDAEEMTMIQNQLKDDEPPTQPKPKRKPPSKKVVEPAVEQAVEPVAEPVATAKPKTPSRKVVEPAVEQAVEPVAEEETIEEPVIEDPVIQPLAKPEPKNKVRVTELHKCPDCGKEMTKKSLRYSHAQNCPAKKSENAIPKPPPKPLGLPKKMIVVKEETPKPTYVIPDEIIQQEILKRVDHLKTLRIQKKQDNIKKLAANIA